MDAVFVHGNGRYEVRPIEALISVYRFPVRKPFSVALDEPVPLLIETDDYELCEHRMFDGRPVYAGKGVEVQQIYGMIPVPIDASKRRGALDCLQREVDKLMVGAYPLDIEERQHVDRCLGDLFYLRRRLVIRLKK